MLEFAEFNVKLRGHPKKLLKGVLEVFKLLRTKENFVRESKDKVTVSAHVFKILIF